MFFSCVTLISGNIAAYSGSTNAAFIDNSDSVTTITGLPGNTLTVGYGINDSNRVVGWSTVGGNDEAWYWDQSVGITTPIGTLGGAMSEAWGINNAGDIVGASTTSLGATDAFWTSAERCTT